MAKSLSSITKIPEQGLRSRVEILLRDNSIARKMSWASRRKTTESEDMAYCLMGLFNVNMDLRYGEGGKEAFSRLQQSIVGISKDPSIFAWTIPLSIPGTRFGLLAPSVDCFANSHGIEVIYRENVRPPPFHMQNCDIVITLDLRRLNDHHYIGYINCESRRIEDRSAIGPLAIYLTQRRIGAKHLQSPLDAWQRVGLYALPSDIQRKLQTGLRAEQFPLERAVALSIAQRSFQGYLLPVPEQINFDNEMFSD